MSGNVEWLHQFPRAVGTNQFPSSFDAGNQEAVDYRELLLPWKLWRPNGCSLSASDTSPIRRKSSSTELQSHENRVNFWSYVSTLALIAPGFAQLLESEPPLPVSSPSA
jgi:hypothetical protein